MSSMKSIGLKLELLANGVNFDADFLSEYSARDDLIEKRRAYGTGDDKLAIRTQKTPQEIILEGGIISAANFSQNSRWRLIFDEGDFAVTDGKDRHAVRFPERPRCYGERLSNGDLLEQVLTVYGDSTLGLFSPGHCYYFNSDRECRFCSLGTARKTVSDHRMKILPELALEAVSTAVNLEPDRFRRVLLNGGTLPDYDKGWMYHLDIIRAIRSACNVHSLRSQLISMPPRNLKLLRDFAPIGTSLAMSIEIFDKKIFEEVCPGKAQDYGREKFIDAFRHAVDALGHGNVYAGLVAGLEPLDSILEGIEFFGEIGVVPAVAVFHPDAGSKYSNYPRPDSKFLTAVGQAMSRVYERNQFLPFIEGSGRNSLDTEAYLQGF